MQTSGAATLCWQMQWLTSLYHKSTFHPGLHKCQSQMQTKNLWLRISQHWDHAVLFTFTNSCDCDEVTFFSGVFFGLFSHLYRPYKDKNLTMKKKNVSRFFEHITQVHISDIWWWIMCANFCMQNRHSNRRHDYFNTVWWNCHWHQFKPVISPL